MDLLNMDIMWRAIRSSQPGFSVEDVAMLSEVNMAEAEEYVLFLLESGFLRRHGADRFATTTSARETIVPPRPCQVEVVELKVRLETGKPPVLLQESTPRAKERYLAAEGVRPTRRSAKVKSRVTLRDRMWAALEHLDTFTRPQLAEAAGVPNTSADDYVKTLLRACQIVEVVPRRGNQPAAYRLAIPWAVERPSHPDLRPRRKEDDHA